MNANELADSLDVESSQAEYGYIVDDWKLFRDAATMLRQQQDKLIKYELRHAEQRKRIEELERLIQELTQENHDLWEQLHGESFDRTASHMAGEYVAHPVKEEAEQQSYQEADGCPTELAVLKIFWRQHNPVKELKNIVVASATCSCGKVMEVTNLQPVKELNDGGEPVKNATYWKRQYNLMATQNDNLKSGLYHANEQIKYLEGQLDIRTRELIGASFYEHDYKTLMEKPPLTDKEIEQIGRKEFGYWDSYNEELLDFARAILRKAQEK